MACGCEKDDCVELGERAAALQDGSEVDCGISNYIDDHAKANEIAMCLSAHLQTCAPASGRFLAKPIAGDYWTLHIVIIDADCNATILVMVDPVAPDSAFTESECRTLVASGDASVVTVGDCGARTDYPRCDS
jgi:hypothetical protein